MKPQKIAILCPYPPDGAPSQRFRYEQYINYLTDKGFHIDIFPFLDPSTNAILYKSGHTIPKIIGVLKGFARRLALLFRLPPYAYVFIHREAAFIGPPVLEWLIVKVLHKKIIIDFDDAIWLERTASGSSWLAKLRNANKLSKICTWAHKISCGNDFLATYARQFNDQVHYIPTTVDTKQVHKYTKKHQKQSPIIIGWTGSVTTMPYLDLVYPVIALLAERYALELHIISNAIPQKMDEMPFVRFIPWSRETEIEALMSFDIGIMPMSDTIWEQGKCGFKAIQYMSVGIPPVVSPVGVNAKIVADGVDGFWAKTQEDWLEKLSLLIESVSLRQEMGEKAQQKIQQYYSVASQKAAYLALFS